MKIIKFIIQICFIANVTCALSTSIPDVLLNCYQSNFTEFIPKPPLIPNLLIEIIRKLEFQNNALNLRRLSNLILHTVKFDGVERSTITNSFVLPYRATGNKFQKFQFITEHLTPGDSDEFPFEALDDFSLCVLHYIISNTIDLLPRGDEKYTCKNIPTERFDDDDEISSCPKELGVIKTKWGTISAGHIIAGIASALQKDDVPLSKLLDGKRLKLNYTISAKSKNILINNVWVSTIGGNLAEVVLNQQTETPIIGSQGYWYNSLFPQAYYINHNYWDMSEPELLGAIDALIISDKVKEFVSNFDGRLRLSQFIDMYYSQRGIAFDPTLKACERKRNIKKLLQEMDLENQVSGTTIALQNIGEYKNYLPEHLITELSIKAVESFKKVVDTLNPDYDQCYDDTNIFPPLEIITLFDGGWSKYEAETFLSYLSETADVSHYGSKIGMINSNKGVLFTNTTSDLIELYKNISAPESVWTSTSTAGTAPISLTKSLHSVIKYYQNNKNVSVCTNFDMAIGNVLLIVAPSAHMTDDEYSGVYDSLRSIKHLKPETKMIIVTAEDNSSKFRQLERSLELNAAVLNVPDPSNIKEINEKIYDALRDQPASLINFFCDNSQSNYETYITPGLVTFFEIHEEYASRANINVKFKGTHYGDVSICAYNLKSIEDKTCKGITVNSEVTFNIKDHCSTESACTVRFAISANSSEFKCTEYECRYPDQVRINIQTAWSGGTNILPLFQLILFITIIANKYIL